MPARHTCACGWGQRHGPMISCSTFQIDLGNSAPTYTFETNLYLTCLLRPVAGALGRTLHFLSQSLRHSLQSHINHIVNFRQKRDKGNEESLKLNRNVRNWNSLWSVASVFSATLNQGTQKYSDERTLSCFGSKLQLHFRQLDIEKYSYIEINYFIYL